MFFKPSPRISSITYIVLVISLRVKYIDIELVCHIANLEELKGSEKGKTSANAEVFLLEAPPVGLEPTTL